jgi:hypothetical protein
MCSLVVHRCEVLCFCAPGTTRAVRVVELLLLLVVVVVFWLLMLSLLCYARWARLTR